MTNYEELIWVLVSGEISIP